MVGAGVKMMVFGAASDVVKPFGDAETGKAGGGASDGRDDKMTTMKMWMGPCKIGPISFSLHGPIQLFFIIVALASVGMLIWILVKKHETVCIVVAIIALVCAFYLAYLGKAIYVLKMFRAEIARFRRENNEYKRRNAEHEKLNSELSSKVSDLGRVEKQLKLLANECEGSVAAARALLEKLERSVKLNTVNSVFLFYDRADRNRSGKIEPEEVDFFVENLTFLWGHLPGFDKEAMKESLKEQGGITLEQVHQLVETTMREADEEAQKKLESAFVKNPEKEFKE